MTCLHKELLCDSHWTIDIGQKGHSVCVCVYIFVFHHILLGHDYVPGIVLSSEDGDINC